MPLRVMPRVSTGTAPSPNDIPPAPSCIPGQNGWMCRGEDGKYVYVPYPVFKPLAPLPPLPPPIQLPLPSQCEPMHGLAQDFSTITPIGPTLTAGQPIVVADLSTLPNYYYPAMTHRPTCVEVEAQLDQIAERIDALSAQGGGEREIKRLEMLAQQIQRRCGLSGTCPACNGLG